jgi:N-acetyl-anhydromuramyl-L-alanine amidase AmpD
MDWPGPFRKSPNREAGNTPTYIVLHGSGGPEKGSESWIADPASKVSYHYFIGKADQRAEDVTQFVRHSDMAWHAGRSRWRDVKNLNAWSIGVGLESLNKANEVYPNNQLKLCRALCLYLMRELDIPASNIITHKMISDPVGRKTDPVNFPYADFIRGVEHPTDDVKVGPLIEELAGLRHFDVLDTRSVFRGIIEKARIVGDKLYIKHEEAS